MQTASRRTPIARLPRRRIALLGLPAMALLAAAAPPPFRDLNHNGRLDPYEDSRLPAERRADDLLRRMTLAEKVGAMLHGNLPNSKAAAGGYDLEAVGHFVDDSHVNSLLTRLIVPPAEAAAQNNAVQRIAERSRLGIPITISSDPRNHFEEVLGASTTGGGFSIWPEALGLAAIGDAALVRRFGSIAAREYRAEGITMALSPQADLVSEPRWAICRHCDHPLPHTVRAGTSKGVFRFAPA